ncbi:MAG TPA: carboxy terminal-processing peptidase [Flavipsychrobacter sp.]|nr:carboxy terminal-processing peptidase [Flavipsychrobacter sp.]
MLEFMKNKILIPLLILGALATFFSFKYSGADENTDKKKELVLQTVMKKIKDEHYTPRDINDSFSRKVYHSLINQLDYDKRFFTQKDIDDLSKFEFKIDDEINANDINFYSQLFETFNKRLDVVESFYKEMLEKPYSFTSNEQIQLDADKIAYAADDKALKERWRTYMKYRVLQKYVELKKAQEGKEVDGDEKKEEVTKKEPPKSDKELEEDARKSVAKVHERYFKRLRNMKEDTRFTLFVNAIAGVEDPHTDYLPPQQKKNFDEMMSGAFYGIGAQLREEDEGVRIVEILPGTPAQKQGELKAQDLIMKVAQGADEPVDIQGMEIDEVITKIKGKKGTEVRLTVKKPDGSIKVIPIIRDKVEREETYAKSMIIKGDNGPVGYIYLPEFYADFGGINGGRACAQDVAVEVEKLKNAGVTGIILDLRYNGGGSLQDVVDMAGLFIEQGPIVQVKSSASMAHTYSDPNRYARGVLYDGPLAIMVNTGSASASEIMAAAMQDYKRAIIVGTPTYGKGTVQKVVPLDDEVDNVTRQLIAASSDGTSTALIGHLKLTVQKFYRINGGSTQLKGVTPDIVFPDVYKYIDVGERSDKAALKWDEIPAAKYKPYEHPVNVAALAEASKKRTATNPAFALIEESALRVKKQKDNDVHSLNEASYRKELDEANAMSKKVEEQEKNATPLVLINPAEDLAKINSDSVNIKRNEDWMKRLKKDIYLSETVNIINDMNKPTMRVNMGTGMK